MKINTFSHYIRCFYSKFKTKSLKALFEYFERIMRNVIIKYLLFLWIFLLSVNSRASEFIQNESPTISPHERNSVVEVAASYAHSSHLYSIEFFFENIEEEIEEIEPNTIQYSTQTQNYRPSFGHLGLPNYNYYYLFNQSLKNYKKYILNCVYRL